MKTMKYAPPKADMKRGPGGPAPKRVNALWDSQVARSHAQSEPVDVAVRDGRNGPMKGITGEYASTAEVNEAMDVYRFNMNRSACRAGTVLKHKYQAARAAEHSTPSIVAIKSAPIFAVEYDRPAAVKPEVRHHGSALEAILGVHAKCMMLSGI